MLPRGQCRLVKLFNELSPGTPVLPCKRRFLPDLYARLVLHTKASTLIARLNGQDRSSWAETVCNLAWRLTARLGKLLLCSRGASGEEGAGSQWRTLDSPRDSPSPAPREAGQLDEVTSSRIKSSVGGGEQALSGREQRMMQEIRSRRLTPLTAISGSRRPDARAHSRASCTTHVTEANTHVVGGVTGVTGLLWQRDHFPSSTRLVFCFQTYA